MVSALTFWVHSLDLQQPLQAPLKEGWFLADGTTGAHRSLSIGPGESWWGHWESIPEGDITWEVLCQLT